MKQIAGIVLTMLVAGCAWIESRPAHGPAVLYSATNHDPFWIATVGKDRILLTLGPAGGRADGELVSYEYAPVVPEITTGVKRWNSGIGTQVLSLETRPGPCATGGRIFAEKTRIYLSGRTLEGCGGQEIKNGNPS